MQKTGTASASRISAPLTGPPQTIAPLDRPIRFVRDLGSAPDPKPDFETRLAQLAAACGLRRRIPARLAGGRLFGTRAMERSDCARLGNCVRERHGLPPRKLPELARIDSRPESGNCVRGVDPSSAELLGETRQPGESTLR